jgi:hypothetical protein
MVDVRGGVDKFSTESGLGVFLTQTGELNGDRLGDLPPGCSIEGLEGQNAAAQLASPFTQFVQPAALNLLPIGFQQLAQNGLISESTYLIVYRIWRQQSGQPNRRCFSNDGPEFSGFSYACPGLVSPDASFLEKLFCMALLRHNVNLVSRARQGVCPFEDLALSLTRKLPYIATPTRMLERETLLWIWLVAIDSWSVGTRPIMLANQGMELLLMLPDRFPETRCWKLCNFEVFGMKFFWRDTMSTWLGPAWERAIKTSIPTATSRANVAPAPILPLPSRSQASLATNDESHDPPTRCTSSPITTIPPPATHLSPIPSSATATTSPAFSRHKQHPLVHAQPWPPPDHSSSALNVHGLAQQLTTLSLFTSRISNRGFSVMEDEGVPVDESESGFQEVGR